MRNLGIAHLTGEGLASILGYPGHRVTAVWIDQQRADQPIKVRIEGPDMPPCPEGAEIEQVPALTRMVIL